MIRTRSTYMLALAVVPSLLAWNSNALAQQKLGYPAGRGSYVRYCGSCHGDDGKGNGPKAASLTPKPSDLTQLAKKNGGSFPSGRVTGILNGSQAIPAHGSAKHPVWGHAFGAGESAAGGNPGPQTVASERIQLIMQYLQTIQEK